jgi:hypothetical protein
MEPVQYMSTLAPIVVVQAALVSSAAAALAALAVAALAAPLMHQMVKLMAAAAAPVSKAVPVVQASRESFASGNTPKLYIS